MSSSSPSCSTSQDCLAKLPTDCASRLAKCAQSKCLTSTASRGDLGKRLTDLLANPLASGSTDLTAHQVAGAIRDTLDLAGACVQRECPDVASICLATLCSRGSCVRSAPAGTQCTQHADCTAWLRGPSAPGTASVPLPDPASVIKPTSSDSGLFVASNTAAWGGIADSPFARTGIAMPRLAFCHKPSRTCRATLSLDSVLGSAASAPPSTSAASSTFSVAYPIRSSNDTRFSFDSPFVPAARARLTSRRCAETAHCPIGVCSVFARQCALDRPLHIHAAFLASPNGGSGAGEGIGPLIAMIAGGIGAAILLAVAGFFAYRAHNPPPKPTQEELAREEAEFVASVHRMSMASGFPASLMSGGQRNSYYAPTDANGKPIAIRPSMESARSGGEGSSQVARTRGGGGGAADHGEEDEFWKFERPDFDKPIGFRRNRTAVNAGGGGSRHSTGSASSSPTYLPSPAAHRLSGTNRMSGVTAVNRPVSSASGIINSSNHNRLSNASAGDHRNSWLTTGGNARRPSAGGPLSPRTPTKLAPVSESDDDTAFVPGSPASLPLGSPRARPTMDDRPVSMVVGSRPAPTAAANGMRASYLSSRRGSALDKPLPVAPTPTMTPTTPVAASSGPMSPLPAMESSAPALSSAASDAPPSAPRSLANPTPEFAAVATSSPAAPATVPVFNLILPTLERSAAEAATLQRADAPPPMPSSHRPSLVDQINVTQRTVTNPPPRRGSFVTSTNTLPAQVEKPETVAVPASPKEPPKDHAVPVSPLMRAAPAPAPASLPSETRPAPDPHHPSLRSPLAPSPTASPRSTPQLASRTIISAHPAVSIPAHKSPSATPSPAHSPNLQPVSIGDILTAPPPRRGSSSNHPPTQRKAVDFQSEPMALLPHEHEQSLAVEGGPVSMDTLDRALSQLAEAVDDWGETRKTEHEKAYRAT